MDKESLSQTLDELHTTASQSDTLTSFRLGSPPPSSSPNADSKDAGDLAQGGLSGLYNRFKDAVGAREKASGNAAFPVGDIADTKRPVPLLSSPLSTSGAVPTLTSAFTSPISTPSTTLRLQSPLSSGVDQGDIAAHKQLKATTATTGVSKSSQEVSAGPSEKRPPLTSLRSATTSIVPPSVAPINVGAVKHLATASSKNSNSPESLACDESSKLKRPRDEQSADEELSRGRSLKKADDISPSTPFQGANPSAESSKILSIQDVLLDESDSESSVRLVTKEAASKSSASAQREWQKGKNGSSVPSTIQNTLDGSHDAQERKSSPKSDAGESQVDIEGDEIKPISVSKEQRYISPKKGVDRAAESVISSKRQQPTNRISQSRLPGFRLSRTSSSETALSSAAGSSAIDSKVSDDGRIQSQGNGGVLPKAAMNDGEVASVHMLQEFRRRVFSKDFWMRDENAKGCFRCGAPFSTWRRKHHCRTCGQIFDAKCTELIPGKIFGQTGSLRVCKQCQVYIEGTKDHSGSSGDSDDDRVLPQSALQSRSKRGLTGQLIGNSRADTEPPKSDVEYHPPTPMMAIPATRRLGGSSSRRSAILEIDPIQYAGRPSSSRSLRTPLTGRPRSSSHKRFSRHQHSRSIRGSFEERAPFHRSAADDTIRNSRLPAFHSDNIIDPDLAPYMSDEGSSEDEEMSILAAMNGGASGSAPGYYDKPSISGTLAGLRRGRSKHGAEKGFGGLSFNSRDVDEISINGLKDKQSHQSTRKRNTSFAGALNSGLTPRRNKSNPLLKLSTSFAESIGDSTVSPFDSASSSIPGSKMMRSASMRGENAPVMELNRASLQHVQNLLKQLLQDSEVPNVPAWEKALLPILLRCTDDVNPNVRHGDDIDIRHYVKMKKIPGGRHGDTAYVSGVVFRKNLALRDMLRSISNPRIMLIRSGIEYQRSQQHFMSLEPLIAQEKESLRNKVNRILEFQPHLLLVQENISGVALQYLNEANVATAFNIKPTAIEAVGRCCRADVNASIEMLNLNPRPLGQCSSFDIKTFVHKDIPGGKRTYMYISGCPKQLGCTIVLRGANMDVLTKVKRIAEFMVYVVYNLKLETCLMRDEFLLIPADTEGGTLSPNKTSTAPSVTADRSCKDEKSLDPISRVSHKMDTKDSSDYTLEKVESFHDAHKVGSIPSSGALPDIPNDESQLPDDVPMPTFYSEMVEKHKTKILSASPFVKFMQPYLLMRAREQERRLVYLKRLRDQDCIEVQGGDQVKSGKFLLITPEMVHETAQGAPQKIKEVLHAVHDAEYDKALYNYQTQKRQWEAYIAGNINLFDPFAHQNIVVLFTLLCTKTTVPCNGPQIMAMKFYEEHETQDSDDFNPDCTLGQFVESICLGVDEICDANGCERTMLDHHRQYVNGDGQISVSLERQPSKIRGMQHCILMWSWCKICKKESQVMPMSESTWNYSFAKYLELSFWSSDLHLRAGQCLHNLHRDHYRFFGFKDLAIRIQYDKIALLEIIVPRARVTWKVDKDLRLKNDVYTKIEGRLNRFMSSVISRIKGIDVDNVVPEKKDACKAEVEALMKRATEEHGFLLHKLQDIYMNSKYYETVPLNRAVRSMQEKVAEWDTTFAEFDDNYFPSEKDIRRLAALQLKKIFLDREASVSSINPTEDGNSTASTDANENGERSRTGSIEIAPKPTQMSPEEAREMLTSVVEENSGLADETPLPVQLEGHIVDQRSVPSKIASEQVQHLDLAVPSNYPDLVDQLPKSPDSKPIRPSTAMNQKAADDELAVSTPVQETIERGREEHIDRAKASPIPFKPISGSTSGIPRPSEPISQRRKPSTASPPLTRSQTQPAKVPGLRSTDSSQRSLAMPSPAESSNINKNHDGLSKGSLVESIKGSERKLSERFGLHSLKSGKKGGGSSLIPRSVGTKKKESKVFSLAKHFEQLSREFEKERLRERRKAAITKQSRAYPMASSRPVVEVYQNVHDAVGEKDSDDDDQNQNSILWPKTAALDHALINKGPSKTSLDQQASEEARATETTAESTETDEGVHTESQTASDTEGDASDTEQLILENIQIPDLLDSSQSLSTEESSLDLRIDLPKSERSTLMKMLANFWAERSASGWSPLEYPLSATDHVFVDSDVIIREDEISSLIAFSLDSADYKAKLQASREQDAEPLEESKDQDSDVPEHGNQDQIERTLLRTTGSHLKYQFREGPASMLCKIFYAEQFDAVRRTCGVADRIVESLARCIKWDSKGGKSKSVFLKTLDDRFVLKSLLPAETQAFLKFAPAYFQIMSEVFFRELPSVIAKMLGFYQVVIRNPVTGTDIKFDLLLMENLFYDRVPQRTFDLKGSMRNRKIEPTGEQNEVLLDENMVDFIFETPLFAREHSKKLLRASVWNDTLFLARQNVMDYSLMIAIDEVRKELVVGIIDCIRTYTWDKKLEYWIKDRGFAGGGRNMPTVTSPKEYKSRFREAMARYVLQAPNCWHQFPSLSNRPFSKPIEPRDGEKVEADLQVLGF